MNFSKTALILVGFQNDYFAQNGILRGVVEEEGRVDAVLESTIAFIRRLSTTKTLIIATPIVLTPDYRALASPSGILHTIKESGAFSLGTPGAESIPEFNEFAGRIMYVGGKVGFNGFSNTQLEEILSAKGIEHVMLAGMITSLCIDSTGRAAYERGYRVIILTDCTSARTAAEQNYYCSHVFPLYGTVAHSDELI